MSGTPTQLPTTLYRIVAHEVPVELDFLSNLALHHPIRNDERRQRGEWAAISLFTTEARARETASEFPSIGSWIAAVNVAKLAAKMVELERTADDEDHFSAWGTPPFFLAALRKNKAVPV